MTHAAEIRKIRNAVRIIKRRTPKEPKTPEEIERATRELDIQIINILIVERSIYQDQGRIHFLDLLGISAKKYLEILDEVFFEKLLAGVDVNAEIENSGPASEDYNTKYEAYCIELVIGELRRRRQYHPRINRRKAIERLEEMRILRKGGFIA